MARPSREKYFKIMVTESEHKTFNNLAIKRHTNVSELVRQLLHREIESSNKEQVA